MARLIPSKRYTTEELRYFWETRNKIIVAENGCWIWQRAKNELGYGLCSFNGRQQRASRVAYILCKGALPKGLYACHNCPGGDNPSCVNPEHLFAGTQQDNVDDYYRKGKWKPRTPPIGSANGSAKVDENIVREIRWKLANGMTQPQAMKHYQLSRAAIQRISSRRSWAHVMDEEPYLTVWGLVI